MSITPSSSSLEPRQQDSKEFSNMHLTPRSFLAIAVFTLNTFSTLSAADLLEAGKKIAVDAKEEDRLSFSSPFLKVVFAANRPNLGFLGVDSLGKGKVDQNIMSKETAPVVYQTTRSTTTGQLTIAYTRNMAASRAEWELTATQKTLRFVSRWSGGAQPEPLVLSFSTGSCYTTVLGLYKQAGDIDLPVAKARPAALAPGSVFKQTGDVNLPAVVHCPGFGSFRLRATGIKEPLIGYQSKFGWQEGWSKIILPPATESSPRIEYCWEVTAIHPLLGEEKDRDPRYDSFRRNWLNILQLSPNYRMLANNVCSAPCGFCFYEYSDIARRTPPLVDGLHALDLIRMTLERVFAGAPTYGMRKWPDGHPLEESADTRPSLLIAASNYVEGRNDLVWLKAHYQQIKTWADTMLATDLDQNGLIEYHSNSGNSDSWKSVWEKIKKMKDRQRPSNWWDTINFGHEDAYANALAYRALQDMGQMATLVGDPNEAARYQAAAAKLKKAYYPAFFNEKTGVLAGWRSTDGELHDYYFLYVNGIAITYGLVPDEQARRIMDRIWTKMAEVGYTNFRLGLPGNLITVLPKDYWERREGCGLGKLPDNSDGFQVYLNGSASACMAYFTVAAYQRVGQPERANKILFPMLDAYENREFEGRNAKGQSNDWRKWDGTAMGYEGFLVDGYLTLLAVLEEP